MPIPLVQDLIARDKFSATYAKAGAEADALGKRMTANSAVMSKAFKAVAVVAATVAGAAVTVGVESVRLASKFEDSQARLAAALKASGSSVDALKTPIAAANKRMEAFGFTNTDTADAIANLTVATRQPAKAIGLLGLAADLARFKHISLADASTTLGKAMAGNLRPIKQLGIDIPVAAGGALKLANANTALSKAQDAYNTALATYNKSPTAANALKLQAALTKLQDAHAKVNSVAGTSNVILGILQQRLGGQAQAAATTFAGKMEVLKARVTDLGIKIGNGLLPPLMAVVDWVSAHWGTISKVFTVVGQVLQTVIRAIATGIQWLINNVIIPTVNWIVAHWPQISAAFQKAWAVIQPLLLATWRLLQALWVNILQPLVAWVQAHWPQISAVMKVVATVVGVALYLIIKALTLLANILTWSVNNVWRPQMALLLNIISGTAAVIIRIWNGLKTAWNSVFNFITSVGGAIIRWFQALPGTISRIFSNAINLLVGAGQNIIRGLWNGIKSLGSWIAATVTQTVPTWIKNALLNADKWLLDTGKNIVTGLWNGIKSLGTWIWNQIKSIIPGWIKSALGIKSPPDWAVDAGQWIARGLANGIKKFPHFLGNLAKMAKDALGALNPLNAPTWNQAALRAAASGGGIPSYQAYAASLFGQLGWGPEQLQPLIDLWNGESGWNPAAYNPNGGATGIPQALPGNKMASEGADWLFNAFTQIRWGLKYIKSVYSTPGNAWQQWQARSPHWYGGGLPPTVFRSPTLIGVGERGPETVSVTPGQHGRGDLSARAIAAAVADALSGAQFRFDGDGIATLVTRRQAAVAVRGGRR